MNAFRTAQRRKAKARVAITGPAGSGKTYSALLVARGLASSWDKIAMIDTEHGSGDLYSDLGKYCIATMKPPYQPERAVKAMGLATESGFEVIILDSMSHFWAGEGGLLELHDRMTGNPYVNWGLITPRQIALVKAILESPVHVIATMRSKIKHEMVEEDGKKKVHKLGLKPIQREGVDYEFDVVLDLNQNHLASCSKDRTSLFDGTMEIPTTGTGERLRDWLDAGADVAEPAPVPESNIAQDKLDAMKREMGGGDE